MYSYDQGGWTPLYSAAYNGHEGAVKELIAAGANINQADKVSKIIMYICNNILEYIVVFLKHFNLFASEFDFHN